MAREEIVTYVLTDDLDGSELGTVSAHANPFARSLKIGDGASAVFYDFDLSDENAAKLEAAKLQANNNLNAAEESCRKIMAEANAAAAELLEPYTQEKFRRKPVVVQAAKTGKKVAPGKMTPAEKEAHRIRLQHIRYWASDHVVDFPKQGRIPVEVQEAYDAGKSVALLTVWARNNQRTLKARPVSAPPAVFAPAVPVQAAPPVEEVKPVSAPPAPAAKATRAKK